MTDTMSLPAQARRPTLRARTPLDPDTVPGETIHARLEERRIGDLEYYNARVHGALFALPNFYRRLTAN